MLPLVVRQPGAVSIPPAGLTLVHEWRDREGVVCAHSYVRAGEWWIAWRHVAFRFTGTGGVEAYPDARLSDRRVVQFFRRFVEPLVLQALGWETLHASAVSTPGGWAVFCGSSGSGKSTIGYALARAGYAQRADDAVVLQFGRSAVRALILPFDARLRPQSAAFFGHGDAGPPLQHARPAARPDADRPSTERLAALFVLSRIDEGLPVATPLSASAAFQALLPHARCFDARSDDVRRRVLEHYLELAASVPVFDLRFAGGLDGLPHVLRAIERAMALGTLEPA